jgi:RNA polymerase sigma-70 factor (ECF subfamily)
LTDRTRRFEAIVLPHLNAAYNLARWLLRDDDGAQDVVQESCLRAFRFFDGFRGDDARPWLLGIVRNSCYSWLREQKQPGEHVEFDDERDSAAIDPALSRASDNPEALLLRKLDRAQVNEAIENLPPAFREVLVLRELEELSYDEIAQVAAIPIGTVMSRLARARALLRAALTPAGEKDEPWKITKIRN